MSKEFVDALVDGNNIEQRKHLVLQWLQGLVML